MISGRESNCVLHTRTSTEKDFGFPPVGSHQPTLIAATHTQSRDHTQNLALSCYPCFGEAVERGRGHLSNCVDECSVYNVLYMQKQSETDGEGKNLLSFSGNSYLCIPGISPRTYRWNQIKRKLQGPVKWQKRALILKLSLKRRQCSAHGRC